KFGIITSLVVAGIATPLLLQHQEQLRLREESHSLRQQKDQAARQLAALRADNLRLSNLLTQANTPSSVQSGSSNEMLRLRGEIARLRADARQSTSGRPANAETSNHP